MSAEWHNLPVELRLQLAGLTTTIDRSHQPNSFGYPIIPDLDTTYMNLSEDCHALFELACQEYLHIHLWGCECLLEEHNDLVGHVFNNFVRNRRFPHTNEYELQYGLKLSALQIEIMCDAASSQPTNGKPPMGGICKRKSFRTASFLAEPDMMLTLYGFLQQYVSETFRMEIQVNTYHTRAKAQAVKVLDRMRKLLCNIYVMPTSTWPEGYNSRRFEAAVGRRITHPMDLVQTFEAHFDTMGEAMQRGIPLEQLVSSLLMYEGTLDTENLQDDGDFFLWPVWSVTRRYLFDLNVDEACAVLQGIGYYMLSRPLEDKEQAHFHVNHEVGLGKLEHTLNYIDTAIWTFDQLVLHQMVTPGEGWLSSVLYARIIILLAWARLNTLQKAPIEGDNADVDIPLPADVDFEYVGDNMDEVFRSSAWGSAKSMMRVARRDLGRLYEWTTTLPPGPMVEEIRDWIAPLVAHALKIEHAQGMKKLSHRMAVEFLNVPFCAPNSGHKFCHLKEGPARAAQHALMAADYWLMG